MPSFAPQQAKPPSSVPQDEAERLKQEMLKIASASSGEGKQQVAKLITDEKEAKELEDMLDDLLW